MIKKLLRIKPLLRKAFLVSSVITVLAVIALTSITMRGMKALPEDLAKLTQASVKAQLLDRDGQPLTVTYQNQWNAHKQIPLHRIPPFLQQAFILAEDKRFYEHSGIDWFARLNALWQNIVALEGVRGASTLSEQVVRMIHKRPRTVWARWLEGWEARQLEKTIDKATILEFYLNQVPYAAQRRGVQQAANYYFDRDVSTLSEKEMLSLAVLVRAPSHFDLKKSTTRLKGRLNTLLKRAARSGLVDDIKRVEKSKLVVSTSKPLLDVSHFASHVYGNTKHQQHQIRTTLDSNYQRVAQDLLDERLAALSERQVANAGLIVVDHQSDEVLVWAVGDNQKKQASNYDTILVKRQPGSTLKPFVYASAMEKGWTAATMIDDSPLKEGVGQGVHAYRNYSNSYYGELPLRNALGNSLNIPAIKAAQFVGVDPLLNTLNKLGMKGLDLASVDYGNGIALGNGEISLHSLVGAYATLARQGLFRPITTTFTQTDSTRRRVFTSQTSSIISNILSDPNARALEFGRNGILDLPVQTAVKTGTSNDYKDSWIVGYNHRYVVGVWMGNLNNESMDRVTGANGPALVLRSMFAELNRNSDTLPLALNRSLIQRKVCIDNGLAAANGCATRSEWFRPSRYSSIKNENVSITQTPKRHYQLAHPIDQMLIARDPRIPDHMEALEFKLSDDDDVRKVDWYLDNQIVASTNSAKYHWPLKAGRHVVKAKVFSGHNNEPTMTQSVSMFVK